MFVFGISAPLLPQRILELEIMAQQTGNSTGSGGSGDGSEVSAAARKVGWLTFAFNLASFLSAAPCGALSDAMGRRPFVSLSLLGTSLDAAALAALPAMGAPWWLLLFTRFLGGLLSPAWSMGFAIAADCAPDPLQRTPAFGLVWMTFGLSMMVSGPIGGALVISSGSTVLPLLGAAGIGLLGIAYVTFAMPETRLAPRVDGRLADDEAGAEKPRLKTLTEAWDWSFLNTFKVAWILLRQSKLAASMAAVYFLVYVGEEGLYDTLVLYLMVQVDFGPGMIGAAVAILGVSLVLVQGGLIRVVVPRFGKERTVLAALLLDVITVAMYGLVTEAWMVFLLLAIRSLALMAGPSMQGVISAEYKDDDQGGVLGLIGALKAATAVVGPVIFNPLFAAFTAPDAPARIPAIVCYAASVIFFVSFVLAGLAMWRWGQNRVFSVSRGGDDDRAYRMLTPEEEEESGSETT
jgi:MFS transporter, DHA1 family, tetracycline resistance protein